MHGVFRHVLAAAGELRPAYILAVGDVEPPAAFDELLAPLAKVGTQFRMLTGNHDSDSPEVWSRIETAPELRLCNSVTWVGEMKVAAIAGVVRSEVFDVPRTHRNDAQLFAGARFDCFQEYRDWLRRRTPPRQWNEDSAVRGRLRRHMTSVFPSTIRQLRKERAHVLLSHEGGQWTMGDHGFQFVDELREALGATRHFHGHHHCRRVRRDGRAMSIGVGLRGLVTLDGDVVRPGELDEQRKEKS
jgi:hypothetical protein